MAVKKFTAAVSFNADVTLPVDEAGKPDVQRMKSNIASFGARDIDVELTPYTGAGKHEWVGSADPGLAHLRICIKCLANPTPKETTCPGTKKP